MARWLYTTFVSWRVKERVPRPYFTLRYRLRECVTLSY